MDTINCSHWDYDKQVDPNMTRLLVILIIFLDHFVEPYDITELILVSDITYSNLTLYDSINQTIS